MSPHPPSHQAQERQARQAQQARQNRQAAQIAARRAQRRRQERQFALILCGVLALLTVIGLGMGYGIGLGARWVRNAWPSSAPALDSDKQHIPAPGLPAGPAQACHESVVEVGVAANPLHMPQWSGGEFVVTIEHVGRQPCVLTDPQGAVVVEVRDHHNTLVWDSARCDASQARSLLITPGESIERRVWWDSSRNGGVQCDDVHPWTHQASYFVTAVLPGVVPAGVGDEPDGLRGIASGRVQFEVVAPVLGLDAEPLPPNAPAPEVVDEPNDDANADAG